MEMHTAKGAFCCEVSTCPRETQDSPETFVQQMSGFVTDVAAKRGGATDAIFLLGPTEKHFIAINCIGTPPDSPVFMKMARKLANFHKAQAILLVISGTVGISPDGKASPDTNKFEGALLISQHDGASGVTVRGLRIKSGACGTHHFVIERDEDRRVLTDPAFDLLGDE